MVIIWTQAQAAVVRLQEEPFGNIQVNELLSRTRPPGLHFYAANCGREPKLEWKAGYLVTNTEHAGNLTLPNKVDMW